MILERADEHVDDAQAELIDRFVRPRARVEAGLVLSGIATAAIDVSDGLVADLGHVCAASGCGAVVEVERLPISSALQRAVGRDAAERLALAGGDDYELCIAVAAEDAERLETAILATGTPLTRIGRLAAGSAIEWLREGRPISPPLRGYAHF
jgi:thiamine-monophosphate kinase